MSTAYKLNVSPTFYMFKDKTIPTGLTLQERFRYLRGCGSPEPAAGTMAMHDRAASLAARLAYLVQESGNPDLMYKAEVALDKWNHECEEFFRNPG